MRGSRPGGWATDFTIIFTYFNLQTRIIRGMRVLWLRFNYWRYLIIVRGITMGHYFAYLQVWCWLILFKVMWFFVLVELQFKNECFSHICHMKAVLLGVC